MIKRSWLLALALGASSGVAQAQAVSGEQAQAAERLFESGTRAFEASEYSRAIDELAESYRLFPSYRTACGLGQVELHLSRYRDAAQHLDFCLKNFPNGDVPTQQRILAGLTEARRRVFALAVRVNVTDAEVRIDGKLVGTVPRQEWFLHDIDPIGGSAESRRTLAEPSDRNTLFTARCTAPTTPRRRVGIDGLTSKDTGGHLGPLQDDPRAPPCVPHGRERPGVAAAARHRRQLCRVGAADGGPRPGPHGDRAGPARPR